MRKTLVLALALGVALPSLAQAQNAPDDRHHHHDDRDADKPGHEKHDRGQHDRGPGPAPMAGPDRGQARPEGRGPMPQGAVSRLDGPRGDGRGYPMPVPGGPAGGGRPDDHGHDRPGAPGGWNQDRGNAGHGWDRDRDAPQGPDRTHTPPGGWNGDRGAPSGGWDRGRTPPPGGWDRDHRSPGNYGYGNDRYGNDSHRDWRQGAPGGWNRGWRQDQRFDWQRFRAYNRDRFRAPRYYAPQGYGYGYRRWYPGIRIQPFFFAQQYWISDPFAYHLPPPPPGCAWVRYYNDVALVDLNGGEVIDVIPDFFF